MLSCFFVLCFLAYVFAQDGSTAQGFIILPCRVVSVHDGDTVTVDVTVRVSVRLLDCWAPEITGEEKEDGLKSKKKLEEFVAGKNGQLTIPIHSNLSQSITFGRLLGRLVVDGKDTSSRMVEAGAATKKKEGD